MMHRTDRPLRLLWRRFLTGLSWATFGVGGLALTIFCFPLINLCVRDKKRRIDMSRGLISATFRFFVRFMHAIGVMDADVASLAGLRSVKGAIIVANHPTILDYVLIASALPHMDCLVKASLRENIFVRGPVIAADYLVNTPSETLLDDCRRRLADGHNILIFPEGTRTVPGKRAKLKRGVAHVALRCNAPLEVVHIHSTPGWLDKTNPWYVIPRSRPKMTFTRGERINPADFIQPGEDGYALASRRLTRKLQEVLLDNPQKNHGYVRKTD